MKSFPSLAFSIAVFALSTGAHVVVLGWASRSFAWVARMRRPLLLACAAIGLVPPISRQITLATRATFTDALHALSMLELTLVLVVALPLLVLNILAHAREGDAPESIARRQAIETLGGAAVLGTTGLALGWGAVRGRHDYQVREIPVRIPGLPRALDGYVIAQVSDIHAGIFVGERELREGFDLVRSIRPDLVVATGDLVDYDARDAPPLMRALADLAPRDGVVAILGNHDYYAGASGVIDAVRRAGITLLLNDARVIRPGDGGGFALLGIDDLWSRRHGGPGPDLARAEALAPRDVPRILLAHQPDAFHFAAGRVALQLSGHTHGGQIRPANLLLRWAAGRYESAGSTLYVNRGFGVAGPPARIGVPPEITKLVLVAG